LSACPDGYREAKGKVVYATNAKISLAKIGYKKNEKKY